MLRFSRPFMGVGLLFGALSVGAADYWVSPDGTGDGRSRENPSGSLKAVSMLAVQGDVIHMMRGTHVVSNEPELAGDVTLVVCTRSGYGEDGSLKSATRKIKIG